MKEYDFTCRRPMHGDEEYAAGATRKLSATDAAVLVRSGALVPKGKAAEDAMRDLLGEETTFGVQRVSDAAMDANNEKAAAAAAPASTASVPKTKAAAPAAARPKRRR